MENCVYLDSKTNIVKTGRINTFDEAHFSSNFKPPGPQQLADLGERKESSVAQDPLPVHIHEGNKSPHVNKPTKKLPVQLTHPDAVPPIRSTTGAAGYNLCSCEDVIIEPGGVGCISLGLIIQLPEGTYGRIAPRSGLSIKKINGTTIPYLDVKAGVIDSDFRGTVKVVLHNLDKAPVQIL